MCLQKRTVGYYGGAMTLIFHGLNSFIAAIEERQKETQAHDVIMDTELKLSFQAYFHDNPLSAAIQASDGLSDGFKLVKDRVFRFMDDAIDDLYHPGSLIAGDYLDTFYPAIQRKVGEEFGFQLPQMPYTAPRKELVELLAA